jgi:hypothetical protein
MNGSDPNNTAITNVPIMRVTSDGVMR